MKEENLDYNQHLKDDLNLRNETAKFLFQCLRCGKLENIKSGLPNIIKAWKTSMVQGVMSSYDQIIDPISSDKYVERTNPLESVENVESSNCYYNNPDWFHQLKFAYQKSHAIKYGQNEYECALYGSFCGNTDAMKEVAKSWDDYLWSYIKTVLFFNVTEYYVEREEDYLEEFNLVNGDYYGSEDTLKEEIKNWPFPKSCPTDFDKILQDTTSKMGSGKLCFPKRESNPFDEVMMLLLQLQLKSARASNTENRWNILVDTIYDLNQVKEFNHEDIIFLGFSVHFLILMYSMRRIDISRSEKFNELIMKFLSTDFEIDSDKMTFYLNFIIDDERKVDFYGGLIFNITDKVVQDRILANIDRHIPELKNDIIESIKIKIVEEEKSYSSKGSNIEEITQKLKFLHYEEHYKEFYQSVVEMGRIFFSNGHWRKVDSLYRELENELDQCEQRDPIFTEDGLFRLLTQERKKHIILVSIEQEVEVYMDICRSVENGTVEKDSSFDHKNSKRRSRLVKKVANLLRDRSQNTILFDYPLLTEYDPSIK
jgi:hypothetical protein